MIIIFQNIDSLEKYKENHWLQIQIKLIKIIFISFFINLQINLEYYLELNNQFIKRLIFLNYLFIKFLNLDILGYKIYLV